MLETTLIYGITFAISLFFCRIYEKVNENDSNIKRILLVLGIIFPPILISTIRYGIGTDYFEYLHYYEMIRKNLSISYIWGFFSKEPLYVIFTCLGHFIDGSIGINFVFSCLYMFFMLKAILYFKDKISITLALFILYLLNYLMSFNIIRQITAVAIIFYAFRYIFEKKPIKYFLWVIIAGMFHKTAYLMILLYLLNFKVDSKTVNKIYYTLILISPLFMVPIQKVIVFLTNKFMIFENYANMEANFDLKFLLHTLPMLILVAIKRKRILEIDKRYEVLIRILFLQIPFQFLGCFVNVADRIAIYFSVFQIMLIPIILKTDMKSENINNLEKNKVLLKFSDKTKRMIINYMMKIRKILNNEKVIKIGIVSWYILYFIVMYAILGGQGTYPYQSIFDNYI